MNAIASSLINGLLSIEPLAKFAKNRARTMMMDRAHDLGVYWRDEVKALRARNSGVDMDPAWDEELAAVTNPQVTYPDYYTTSFHAYDEGNLGWLPAMEVDVAARAVHAQIWPEGDERAGVNGDAMLRQSYHQVLKDVLPEAPKHIVDLGSSAGLSTFTLQETFPNAELTGVELSPYFVAAAHYADKQRAAQKRHAQQQSSPQASPQGNNIRWVHAAAEDTGLPAGSADLVSVCLVFHELPTSAANDIMAEAHRLLRPGGHFAIMDMNPQCERFAKMPPYVLTLLKSTEPYLDQYFSLDMVEAFQQAGFDSPKMVLNSPRHHTIVGRKT
ncbi:MAG: class I SAM-dependent methyltransferase [Cyanobacteria bacterium P01_F01_bin.53]